VEFVEKEIANNRPRSPSAILYATRFCVASCLILWGSSCSGNKDGVYPVRGSVIVDGEPAEHANVLFVPVDSSDEIPQASAVVGADGEFQLTTYRQFDGAKPGEYLVRISWAIPVDSDVSEPDYGPELLPKKYLDPKTSGLTVLIEAKNNVLEPFELAK
jgi:hypothetical protein